MDISHSCFARVRVIVFLFFFLPCVFYFWITDIFCLAWLRSSSWLIIKQHNKNQCHGLNIHSCFARVRVIVFLFFLLPCVFYFWINDIFCLAWLRSSSWLIIKQAQQNSMSWIKYKWSLRDMLHISKTARNKTVHTHWNHCGVDICLTASREFVHFFFFKLGLFLYFLWWKWTDERIWPSGCLARCQHRRARVRDARPPNLNEILISFFFFKLLVF